MNLSRVIATFGRWLRAVTPHPLVHHCLNLLHYVAGYAAGAVSLVQGWAKPQLMRNESLFPQLGEASERVRNQILTTLRRESLGYGA